MARKIQTNAADEVEINTAKTRERLRAEREANDLRAILATEQGRRFYWNLLCYCRIFTSSMTGNSQTFFHEGMRQVGLKLLADLNDHAPEAYFLMLKESKEDDLA